jgi:hypothetical protein
VSEERGVEFSNSFGVENHSSDTLSEKKKETGKGGNHSGKVFTQNHETNVNTVKQKS